MNFGEEPELPPFQPDACEPILKLESFPDSHISARKNEESSFSTFEMVKVDELVVWICIDIFNLLKYWYNLSLTYTFCCPASVAFFFKPRRRCKYSAIWWWVYWSPLHSTIWGKWRKGSRVWGRLFIWSKRWSGSIGRTATIIETRCKNQSCIKDRQLLLREKAILERNLVKHEECINGMSRQHTEILKIFNRKDEEIQSWTQQLAGI